MNKLRKKYESTMYALRGCLHQGSLERDWLQDIERYVSKLEVLSKIDSWNLIEEQAVELQKRQNKIDLLIEEINYIKKLTGLL